MEVPQPSSSDAESLFAEMTYWQSIHGGRTTSGYSGHPNRPFDDRLAWASPFASRRLREASYPAEGNFERFDVVTQAGFLDYAWLYLERNGLRYVVLHHHAEDLGYNVERLAALLEDARIYDDGTVAIYDRLKIRRPTAPVPLCGEGWGTLGLLPRDGFVRLVGPDASVDYYNPDPEMPLVLAVRARSLGRNRRVRVLAGDEVVADWHFGPKDPAIQATRPFRAAEGIGRLRIECDGEAPAELVHTYFDGTDGAVSLIVSGVCLRPAEAAPERPVARDRFRVGRGVGGGPLTATPGRRVADAMTDGTHEPSATNDFPGWRATGIAAIVYAAATAVATFPMVLHSTTAMPQSGPDGLQHLWVMRWYRSCLVEGRAPWFSADLQYPVGVPLGYFSPLHLQSLLYLPLSFLTGNDILIYNVIWSTAIVTTGLGTFVLGWHVLRDRASATVAGLLAMLSGPMRLHSYGHLELVTLGAFPLFLVLWMRFVDRPSRGRLLGAAGGYVLLAMSAAYYLVFAVFPAALYAVWRMVGAARRREWRAIGRLAGWLAGFAGLVVPALLLLFSAHVWTIAHGHDMGRLRFEFEHYRAPLWSYLVPIPGDLASGLLPFNPYDRAGLGPVPMELVSYLGIATLVLLHRAWFRRVAFVASGFLWTSLALMVVLSLGPHVQIGGLAVPMPAGWLWDHFPPMRMTRVPARFNLFAAVLAAVVAGAGLRDLLASRHRRAVRTALAMAIGGLAVADLSLLPFGTQTHPPMPAAYASLLERSPETHILEAPHHDSALMTCRRWRPTGSRSTAAPRRPATPVT